LHVVKLFVKLLVLLVGQLQTLYVLERYGQVIVVPRIVDATKNLIRHADLGQDQEEPFRSFEDPFHVSVVGQPFSKSEWPVEKPALFAPQLRDNKGPRDFRLNAFVSPPELFQRGMGRDKRMTPVAVDVCIEGNLTSRGSDLGECARAHDLERAGKTPALQGAVWSKAQAVDDSWALPGNLFEVGASRLPCGVVSWILCEEREW
jgi:hypothetical protein